MMFSMNFLISDHYFRDLIYCYIFLSYEEPNHKKIYTNERLFYMKKKSKPMTEIQNSIAELADDVSLDAIRKSLNASDSDNVYTISEHNRRMPEFVMFTKDETLLANMNYLLEDVVLNNKVTIKKPSIWYKNDTKYGIKICPHYKNKYAYNLKKYSYYIYPKLVDTNTAGIYMIPVFKCMTLGRLICIGNFIAKSMTQPKELMELDILGFTFNGVGETLNTYKKMFEKRYSEPLDLIVYAEVSFDNVDIENFFEEYNSPYYSSELDDVISRIIFVINSRKHTFHTVFPEDICK